MKSQFSSFGIREAGSFEVGEGPGVMVAQGGCGCGCGGSCGGGEASCGHGSSCGGSGGGEILSGGYEGELWQPAVEVPDWPDRFPNRQEVVPDVTFSLCEQAMENTQPPRVCGPDATDYVTRELIKVMNSVADGDWDDWTNVAEGSDIDLKGKELGQNADGEPDFFPRAQMGECPTRCGWAITLCGMCVSDQIPGNIGLGTFGKGLARVIGAVTDDSGEDKTSYDIGDSLMKKFYYTPHPLSLIVSGKPQDPDEAGYTYGYSEHDVRKVREALCKKLKQAALPKGECKPDRSDPGIEQVQCRPCTKVLKKAPKGPPIRNMMDAHYYYPDDYMNKFKEVLEARETWNW